jgi:hypothetical protein
LCFDDTYLEGEPESLPELDPPADATTESRFPNAQIQQPIRGFGKVWRETEGLRERLGWALAPEVEINTRRDYLAGGVVDETDTYVPAPGEFRLFSFYNETFVFIESELNAPCPSGTWRTRS